MSFLGLVSAAEASPVNPPTVSLGHKSANGAAAAVTAGLGAIIVLVLGIAAYQIHAAYREAIARAERETFNAQKALVEHTVQSFDVVARALEAAAELRRDVDAGSLSNRSHIHDLLRAVHGRSPVILALGWADAAGNRLFSSIFRDPPPLNIADQEAFQVHQGGNSTGMYIGTPIQARIGGAWALPVSRRVETHDGAFAGIVQALVRMDYFTQFYGAIDLGQNMSVLLWRRDGLVLIRKPHADQWYGKSMAASKIFSEHLPRAPSGTYHTESPIDGQTRIVSYGTVPDLPLVIGASMARSDALGFVRQQVETELLVLAAVIAALGFGGTLLVRLIRHQEITSAALARNATLLRSVFTSMNQGIAVFDANERLVASNHELARMFGTERFDEGRTLESVLRDLASCGEYGADADNAIRHRLSLARARSAHRYERVRTDGSVIEACWIPLPDGMLAVTHTDITALKQHESELAARKEELDRQVQELEAAKIALETYGEQQVELVEKLSEAKAAAEAGVRAKSDFLAVMAHEIRTPISGVIGIATMLLDTKLDERQREWIQAARDSADSLVTLINDLLDLSKVEAGRIELEHIGFAPSPLAEGVVTLLKPRADAKGLQLSLHLDPRMPPQLNGDPTRLRQVMFNLVGNAIKFTDSGHVRVMMRWRRTAKGPGLLFGVSDTGIGLSSTARSKLFSRYAQGEQSTTRRFGGTGLGLAISRHFVELMGGRIGTRSKQGAGSLFWFWVPIETGSQADKAVSSNPEPPDTRVLRILVAEDNAINRMIIEAILAKAGHEVALVGDGRQAVETIKSERYDVVLMDMEMPEMDGLQAARTIRGLAGPICEVPIICLTANASAEDGVRAMAAGMNAHVVKPINPMDLLNTIASVVAQPTPDDTRN